MKCLLNKYSRLGNKLIFFYTLIVRSFYIIQIIFEGLFPAFIQLANEDSSWLYSEIKYFSCLTICFPLMCMDIIAEIANLL